MKKIISTLMIIAAAAISFSSCQKQEMIAPEASQEVTLTFASEKPAFADETKTEWNGETIQWSEGDKIRVAYTAGGVWQNADGNATVDEENGSKTAKIYASNSVEAGEIASFSVPGSFTIPTGVDLEFYGVYPSTASGADMPYAPSVTVTIPAEQKPLKNSFDSKADLMAARSVSTYILTEGNSLPEAIPLMWTRLVAHGYFTLKNLAVVGEENIESIVLTANDGADMVGQHYLYLDTYNVVKPNGNSVPNKLTIDATNLTIANSSVSFWACFLPCTWTSVAVQIETDKATYTREIDLTADQKTFAKNARNTLSINMATATRDEKEVSVGTLPFVKDFSEMTGTNELAELDGFSELSYVYQNTSSIRLATTKAAGLLKTNPLNLSQNFHVIVTARGWADDEMQMTVSAGEQEHNVDLTTYGTNGEFVEYVMNFTPVGESATVSFTAAKEKRYYIQKIQVLAGHVELPSTITVTAPEQMPAEGGNGSFSYTLTNPKDGLELTVSEDADWITDVEAAEGTVTYTVEANITEDPREAVITLTYGDLTETVTVSQKGQAAVGVAYYEKVTSALTDWSGEYLLVYESDKYLFDGSLTDVDSSPNYITLQSISDRLSFADYSQYAVTIEKYETGYSVKTASGYYIGRSANSNGFNSSTSTRYVNTVSFVDGMIKIAGSGGRVFNYNSQSGKFRFFASTNAPLVSAYKLVGGNEGGETPVEKTLESIAVSDAKTEYTVGDEFVKPTVTATYSDDSTEDVTASAEFTGYNMSAADTYTVTVSYSGKTTTYSITVSAAQGGGEEQSSITVSKTIADIATANGWVNSTQYKTINLNEVIKATVTGGGNTGKYYNSGTNWRIYQNENPSLTISASQGYTIESVKITYTVDNKGILTYNSSNVTSGTTVDVNASSITFGVGNTGTATNGQVRVTAIEVVYHQAN